MNKLWVELVHEQYKERASRDAFTADHYTGAVKDKAVDKAEKLSKGGDKKKRAEVYLYRRAQGESIDAYLERVVLSKYPRHHAAVVDSFSGSVFAVENKADRTLEAFGEIDDESSFAYKIWRDADGEGTNYCTMYKQAASMFSNFNRVWYLVEEDTFTWIPGSRVKNWFYDENGILSDVLVEETVDGRESIKTPYGKDEERLRWVHYHKKGFDRYRIVKDSKGERSLEWIEDESGDWEYPHYNDASGNDITVPIGFIDLPFPSDAKPGYSMAQDSNYLYNLLSDIRNLLRWANHPKLAGEVMDEEFEYTEAKLQEGSNMLQGKWSYISPSPENAAVAYEIYKQEVRDFFVTSHQRYNDAAREVTATEARQDDQSGRQAYMIILSGALDELDNRVLFFLAQKQFPRDRSKWLTNSVTRSTDFKAEDSGAFADRLAKLFFSGSDIPIGEQGKNNVALKIAALLGIEVDDGEVEAELEQSAIAAEQERAANEDLEALLADA